MKNKKSHVIFDWVVIILEITYSIAITMHVFFLIPGVKALIALFLFMFMSHVIRFGMKFTILSEIVKTPILSLFFMILILDIFQSLLFADSFIQTGFVILLSINHFLFLSFLYNVFKESGSFKYVLSPYVGYSLYNIVVIMLTALLVIIGLPWEINMLTDNVRILGDDIAGGGEYYFPYFLSIAANFHPIQIFGNLPGLTGLSHEPHIIMMIISPALLMGLLYKSSKRIKIVLAFSYLFIALNSMSSTNVICILVVLFFQLLWMTLSSRDMKNLMLLIVFLAVVVVAGYEVLDSVYLQVASKFESSNSRDYSSNMLKYVISFDSFLGYGNFPPETGSYKPGETAGILTGIMDVALYIVLFIKTIKLVFSSSYSKHYFGLGFLYFLMHGMKVNYLFFLYPFFSYMIFLMILMTKYNFTTSIQSGNRLIETVK